MSDPVERLLAAADLLDERASEATEGPWFNTRDGELKNARNWDVVDRYGAGSKDARYIATVHPEVGKALVAVLRMEATRIDATEKAFPRYVPDPEILTLADLLLAGDR